MRGYIWKSSRNLVALISVLESYQPHCAPQAGRGALWRSIFHSEPPVKSGLPLATTPSHYHESRGPPLGIRHFGIRRSGATRLDAQPLRPRNTFPHKSPTWG